MTLADHSNHILKNKSQEMWLIKLKLKKKTLFQHPNLSFLIPTHAHSKALIAIFFGWRK